MSSTDPSNASSSYVIDIEEGAETIRLVEQDTLFTQAMGGLFPENIDLTHAERLLDIACGPGKWTTDVAVKHHQIQVTGIDINPTIVNFATSWAKTQRAQNIEFAVMDARKPLLFANNTFDFVNARLLIGFMNKASWPILLTECHRILKPGGVLRLTEIELGESNSVALDQFSQIFCRIMAQQGRTFSTHGRSLGITYMLGKLLKDAKFTHIANHAFAIDSSYGLSLHDKMCNDILSIFTLLKPYIIQSSMMNENDYDNIHAQVIQDMQQEGYVGVTFGLTVWGTRP